VNLDLDELDCHLQAAQDLILAYRRGLGDDPVLPGIAYHELARLLDEPLPIEGQGCEKALSAVKQLVIPGCTKVGHPRFLAWMNNSSCDAGILGEMINAGLAQVPFTFKGGKSATAIEHLTGRWFCQIFGLPEAATASFTGGGSLANLTALAVAREFQFPGAMQGGLPDGARTPRLYMSEQGHVSIERAAGLLGLGIRNIVRIATDASHRIDLQALEAAIRRDQAGGPGPFCVVAQAGSASVGAVDDIEALADLCADHQLWLHVDAAYGGAAILTERGKRLLAGIERADSITTDPHKWFSMPVEAGLVLFRNSNQLVETFLQSSCASYRGPMDEINLMNRGLQIAQAPKAFKVWFALKVHGLKKIRDCVEKDLGLAQHFAAEMAKRDGWELLNDVQLSTVCARFVPGRRDDGETDALQHRILERLEASGAALLSPVVVDGKVGIRVCFANHRTGQGDVEILVDALTRIAMEFCP
jgi:aromatic-L-amino-acid decarboxylase